MTVLAPTAPELWGGVECTVNRVGDVFRDQLHLTGHHDRIGDLARFAALGITRLRYPVLWESVCPDGPEAFDWRWSDARLAEIGRLGMTPIVGLIHHGSGPRYTNLLDPRFPQLFADYAAAVAARYPWVTDWTAVNEPLTTARFSALYGIWYPHAQDDRSFWMALLNQIDATRLAMRAIRAVNPSARLIQTDDLGHNYATPGTTDAAEYYNERRWLGWDLLFGRVRPGHALWPRVTALGLEDRVRAISDDPCPPDIVGINHYITSDRALTVDPALGPLPACGFHDVVAARVLDPAVPGVALALAEATARYPRPVALTECHLGCTREEQMRWLDECWQACVAARAKGADIVALTAWALVGGVDWDSLLTREAGHYEPGAFVADGASVRPTGLAAMLAELGRDGTVPTDAATRALLARPGWWRRPARFEVRDITGAEPVPAGVVAPLLITGPSTAAARHVAAACALRGIDHVVSDDRAPLTALIARYQPWAVVRLSGTSAGHLDDPDTAGCRIPCHSLSSDQLSHGLDARSPVMLALDLLIDRAVGVSARRDTEQATDAPREPALMPEPQLA